VDPLPRPGRPRLALQWGLLASITLLALYLRLHALGARSFWFDECVSAGIARLRWSQFFLALWNREANMSMYYALLHFWMWMGKSEPTLRGLSALFSVATVPLIYVLGERLFGRRAGLFVAWLFAINAVSVRYAQEARSYALVVLLVVLATWLFMRNLQDPARAHWIAYGAVSALAVYAHFYAALIVPAHAVSLFTLGRREIPRRNLLLSLLLWAFLIGPLAVVVLRIGSGPLNWIPAPNAATIYYFFEQLSGHGGWALLLIEALVLLWAAISTSRARADGRGTEIWSFSLVLSLLLVPPVSTLLFSLVRSVFFPRYLIICLPAMLLGVAAGLARLRPAPLGWLVLAAISVFSLKGTLALYHQDFAVWPEDWRGATFYVLDHAQPNDGIFFEPLARTAFDYYQSQRSSTPVALQIIYPPYSGSSEYRNFVKVPLAEALREALPAPNRVWLVLFNTNHGEPSTTPEPAELMLRAVYGRSRRLADRKIFSGVTILLFAPDAGDKSPPLPQSR
jgi:mannosyltransferase